MAITFQPQYRIVQVILYCSHKITTNTIINNKQHGDGN